MLAKVIGGPRSNVTKTITKQISVFGRIKPLAVIEIPPLTAIIVIESLYYYFSIKTTKS